MQKHCEQCGCEFIAARPQARFCSPACVGKSQQRTHCKHGHPLDRERVDRPGTYYCTTCSRLKSKGRRLYGIWKGMVYRCHGVQPGKRDYKFYRGRGIAVCDEWRHDFAAFRAWAISNGYTPGMSIDRVENDLGYSPDNCRWATRVEQERNKSKSLTLTIDGVTRHLKAWCEMSGVNYATAVSRMKKGWPASDVISPELVHWKHRHSA